MGPQIVEQRNCLFSKITQITNIRFLNSFSSSLVFRNSKHIRVTCSVKISNSNSQTQSCLEQCFDSLFHRPNQYMVISMSTLQCMKPIKIVSKTSELACKLRTKVQLYIASKYRWKVRWIVGYLETDIHSSRSPLNCFYVIAPQFGNNIRKKIGKCIHSFELILQWYVSFY